MNTQDFGLKLKGLEDDTGAFTGSAAVYHNTDLTGDVIEPGAFNHAISQQGKGFPLLFAHRQDMPLGVGRIEDSPAALIVHGKILMEDPAAARVYAHLKAGSIRGLSIGYTTPRDEKKVSYRNDGTRVLKEIHLHEISVVAIPANPLAQVQAVKSLADVRLLLTSLRAQSVDGDELAELLEIGRELNQILATHDPDRKASADMLSELQTFAAEMKRYSA